MHKDDNTLLAGFFAILPSLSQVLAVMAISFDRKINIGQYFYFDSIPLLNIFALVISILTIALIYIFEYSPEVNGSNIEFVPAVDGKPAFIKNTENCLRRKFLVKFALITFGSGIILLFTMFSRLSGVPVNLFLSFIQALAYIIFFVFTAGLIYTWIIFRLKKTQDWAPHKLIPNIKETLLKAGYVKKDEIQVISADQENPNEPANTNRKVVCKVGEVTYNLVMSYRGEEILGSNIQ